MQKFEIRAKILSFLAITRPKSKNSKFRFKDLMRTVPRNIPMKFYRSNMKTEGGVRKSLSADAADAAAAADGLYILLSTLPPSSVGTKRRCSA